MFGVVGNISPQQIKFPPVCPPKMFATPLDCLLIIKKYKIIIIININLKYVGIAETWEYCILAMTFELVLY